ncbi:acyl carrier protein [Nannocystaceae bacterium ST9]
MDANEVNRSLKRHIVDTLLHGDESELDDDTPLLELGVIDSLAMVGLLAFLTSEFGVRVPDREVSPRNFASLAALTRLVVRELAARDANEGGEHA